MKKGFDTLRELDRCTELYNRNNSQSKLKLVAQLKLIAVFITVA